MITQQSSKKGLYAVLVVIIVMFIITVYLFDVKPVAMPYAFSVNNKTYNITGYAYTQTQQARGLMNATVTNSTFMLFGFPRPGVYEFWMKDTYNGLDIIWIDYNSTGGKVVYYVNATPCVDYDNLQQNCIVYTPNVLADYVIETKSGFVKQNNITIGDNIKFLFNK